jgi:hypothetical protein
MWSRSTVRRVERPWRSMDEAAKQHRSSSLVREPRVKSPDPLQTPEESNNEENQKAVLQFQVWP